MTNMCNSHTCPTCGVDMIVTIILPLDANLVRVRRDVVGHTRIRVPIWNQICDPHCHPSLGRSGQICGNTLALNGRIYHRPNMVVTQHCQCVVVRLLLANCHSFVVAIVPCCKGNFVPCFHPYCCCSFRW